MAYICCHTNAMLYYYSHLQSDLAETILERNSVEDDDVDSVFDVLSALSSLNSSVSGLNATVEIVGNLVGIFTANSSLINIDRGQVDTFCWYVTCCVRLAIHL